MSMREREGKRIAEIVLLIWQEMQLLVLATNTVKVARFKI